MLLRVEVRLLGLGAAASASFALVLRVLESRKTRFLLPRLVVAELGPVPCSWLLAFVSPAERAEGEPSRCVRNQRLVRAVESRDGDNAPRTKIVPSMISVPGSAEW